MTTKFNPQIDKITRQSKAAVIASCKLLYELQRSQVEIKELVAESQRQIVASDVILPPPLDLLLAPYREMPDLTSARQKNNPNSSD